MAHLMRALVGLAMVSGLVALVSASPTAQAADTRPHRKPAQASAPGHTKHRGQKSQRAKAKPKLTSARTARITTVREREHIETRELARGQSVGAPQSAHAGVTFRPQGAS